MRLTGILFAVFLISLFLSTDARLRFKDETTSCENEADFECAPGVCIDASLTCNSAYDCASMADEAVILCGCPTGEFKCLNSCIPLEMRCDRHNDCSDGSDEDNCDSFQCLPGFHKCKNHYCVPSIYWCDYVDDCGDRSDEEHCERTECWESQFTCKNDQCINPFFLCDGTEDCTDGSDEDEATCTPDNFVDCGDGIRVHKQHICDGVAQCKLNGADETNCNCTGQFACDNKCLPPSQVCDRHCDCPSCADEAECDNADGCDLNTHIICPPSEGKPLTCLRMEYLCDSVAHCPSRVDERFCSVLERGKSCSEIGLTSCGTTDPRCTHFPSVCNWQLECLGGVDKANCQVPECGADEVQCRADGRCLPESYRCDTLIDCLDGSDEEDCESHVCPEGYWQCAAGHCIFESSVCDHKVDCYYHKNFSRDTSDEANCSYRQCKEDEFQCLSGQCIPAGLRCYSVFQNAYGCPDFSHLRNCSDFVCQEGYYKCDRSHCINASLVCNGEIDCIDTWDDESSKPEELCQQRCSVGCNCSRYDQSCFNLGLIQDLFNINTKDSRRIINFNLSGNHLPYLLEDSTALMGLERMRTLDLSNNSVTFINKEALKNIGKIQSLILADNNITDLGNFTFADLGHLKTLVLRGNNMQSVLKQIFTGLKNLTILDLSHQRIQYIEQGAFNGLHKLASIDLSNNLLSNLPSGAFFGLNQLKKIDVANNVLQTIHAETFYGLPKLRELHTDEFRFCCMVREIVTVETCTPAAPDEFSSCKDLMANAFLRGSIWVIGIIASIGNLAVIMMRMNNKRDNRFFVRQTPHGNQFPEPEGLTWVHSFLITNLAIGDFCMGVYLLIIASVDAYSRGYYSVFDTVWRQSALCRFAGFLSTFSSELSVFSLTIITLHRLLSILFPFRIKDMEYSGAVRVMVVAWLIVILLAVFPLFGLSYFGNFYGRSGVCLAFHITPDRPAGWEYSVFIFLGLNFISFLTIAFSYSVMFVVARRTQKAVNRSRDTNSGDAMARRMTLIVMTDFFCWVPIILLGAASLCGAHIPPQVYAWVAVFVLPLNSAVNPMLYTLLTAPYVRRVMSRARTSLNISLSTMTTDMKQVNLADRQGRMSNGRHGWQKGIRLPKADTNRNAIKLNTVISQSDTEPDEPAAVTAPARSEELNLLGDHPAPTQGAESEKETEASLHTANV